MNNRLYKHSWLLALLFTLLTLLLSSISAFAVDGDTNLDAVFANFGQRDRVCLGGGSGSFTCSDVSTDTNFNSDVALGDVNGDTKLDVVYANFDSADSNQVCLGDGSGGFTCSDVSSDTNRSFGVALGDVDGDTKLDAVFSNAGDAGVSNRVCLGNGSGGFTCSDVSSDTNNSPGVALGDVNGDTKLDAVFANDAGASNRVCLGDGSGGFTCSDVSSDTNSTFRVALGFLNNDTNLDAVFANSSGQPNRVCLGDGSGGFTCSDVSSDTNNSIAVALGDVDGDTNLDAVFANEIVSNRVCLGDGSGGFTCSNVSSDTNTSGGVALSGDTVPPTNQSPTADAGGPYLVAVGEQVSFDGSGSSDPDSDPLTETWTADGGTVSGNTYTAGSVSGIYDMTLVVNDGQADSEPDTTIVVVYDPSGGFVTGGGWIESAADACPNFCGGATGKANFGFVSKYKKGASTPSGNTEFNFKAGNLNFHSDEYQWLVINRGDSRAQYKGSGTINGDAGPGDGYKFIIWAQDLDSTSDDTFRIRIWYEDGGEVVAYDNGTDQALRGGNVKIHKGK